MAPSFWPKLMAAPYISGVAHRLHSPWAFQGLVRVMGAAKLVAPTPSALVARVSRVPRKTGELGLFAELT